MPNVVLCAFVSFFGDVAGVTLRSNSVKRSGRRRARRISAGMNEDVLATDSGVFEAWSRRLKWHFNKEMHTYITHALSKKNFLNAHGRILAKHTFCMPSRRT